MRSAYADKTADEEMMKITLTTHTSVNSPKMLILSLVFAHVPLQWKSALRQLTLIIRLVS